MLADDTDSLPAIYLRELLDVCARFGVPPEDVLRGSGVSLESVARSSTRVSFAQAEQIIASAIRLTGEPGLSFYMGLQMRASLHGFVGIAAMMAPTLRHAAELAERFASTRTAALGLSLVEEGETASLTLIERVPLGGIEQFVVGALFMGIQRIAETVTGQTLEGIVDVRFAEPEHFERFRHLIHGTIRFEQPSHRLVFPRSTLDLPLLSADAAALELARERCEAELAQLGEALHLIDSIRALIRKSEGEVPTADEVAKRLHVSTRTLKRRLAEHNTSYSDVLTGVLRERAIALLDDPKLSVEEVAGRLGYSDVANFTRAFRRWTGRTPAGHRAAKRGAS